MSLVRTLVAYCDHMGCLTTIEVYPATSQPYVLLTAEGWTLVNTDDQIETYCPQHPATPSTPTSTPTTSRETP